MRKIRELFKEIRHTKETFHAKMGTIKDRNGKDLTEEEIKKRCQEITEELYPPPKKGLNEPNNHDRVVTHPDQDFLECEVKWALGTRTMNKASRGDRIPAELFQILKDGGVKVLHSTCQQIWKPQESPQDGKKSVYIPIPKKGNTKECSNYHTVTLISHASNLVIASVNPSQNPMHKILQAKLQKYLNRELPDVQGGYRKGRGIRDQIANICWIVEKAKEFQKNICFIDYTKAFDCMDHNKVENS